MNIYYIILYILLIHFLFLSWLNSAANGDASAAAGRAALTLRPPPRRRSSRSRSAPPRPASYDMYPMARNLNVVHDLQYMTFDIRYVVHGSSSRQ